MPADRDPWYPRTSDEVWTDIFHPETLAGIHAAEVIRERSLFEFLEHQVGEPRCDLAGCDNDAGIYLRCRHSGKVFALVCRQCAVIIANDRTPKPCVCSRSGPPAHLWVFTPIFDGRNRR